VKIIALAAWLTTAAFGLYLFAVWLIEHDGSKGGGTASRLRAPVIFSHVLLAVTGLVVWVLYLYLDQTRIAWTAFFILLPVAILGFIMLTRWIPVHRAANVGAPLVAHTGSGPPGADLTGPPGADPAGPPERNFPVPVVVAHGLFAVITVALVTLTAFGLIST
jgi:manganese efflux pump family protein